MELPLVNKIIVYTLFGATCAVLGAAGALRFRPPVVTEKVVEVEKKVEVEVVKWKTKVVNRTVVEQRTDGTVLTTKETENETGQVQEREKTTQEHRSNVVVTEGTTARWALGVHYLQPVKFPLKEFSSSSIRLVGGMNLFGPLWAEVSTNVDFPPTVGLGIRMEF